jgi:hypothetical protein
MGLIHDQHLTGGQVLPTRSEVREQEVMISHQDIRAKLTSARFLIKTFPTLPAILARAKFRYPADMIPSLRRKRKIEFRSEPRTATARPIRERSDLSRASE